MKVLYLHQYFKFPDENGGTRSYDLARAFIERDIKVEIITTTSDEKYKSSGQWIKLERDGLLLHLRYLPISNNFSYLKRIIVFIKFIWFASFKLIRLKGDCVLATSTPLTIGIPALLKKWYNKTPFIFEVRDVWPEAVIAIGAIKNPIIKRILYYLEYLIYKNAAAIVPLSTDMKLTIINRFPQLSNKPVQVIENISEIRRFQNYADNSSFLMNKIGYCPRFTILYAGTFGRVNGINYVLELAAGLINIDSSICFLLVGDGLEKTTIVEAAKAKGIFNKNVFFLDSVSKQQLPQLYHECNMGSSFVINIEELWANSANKFFDTLAAGRPMLINHGGWQKEMIEMRNVGYVLPQVLNYDAIKLFAEYTCNSLLINKQRENALELAKEKYSLEVAANRYLKTFAEIKMYSIEPIKSQ